MPRIAMEPAVVVVARVRSMSSESNVGPALPAVKPHDTVHLPPRAGAPTPRPRPPHLSGRIRPSAS